MIKKAVIITLTVCLIGMLTEFLRVKELKNNAIELKAYIIDKQVRSTRGGTSYYVHFIPFEIDETEFIPENLKNKTVYYDKVKYPVYKAINKKSVYPIVKNSMRENQYKIGTQENISIIHSVFSTISGSVFLMLTIAIIVNMIFDREKETQH